jgi:hypothetical protein
MRDHAASTANTRQSERLLRRTIPNIPTDGGPNQLRRICHLHIAGGEGHDHKRNGRQCQHCRRRNKHPSHEGQPRSRHSFCPQSVLYHPQIHAILRRDAVGARNIGEATPNRIQPISVFAGRNGQQVFGFFSLMPTQANVQRSSHAGRPSGLSVPADTVRP